MGKHATINMGPFVLAFKAAFGGLFNSSDGVPKACNANVLGRCAANVQLIGGGPFRFFSNRDSDILLSKKNGRKLQRGCRAMLHGANTILF